MKNYFNQILVLMITAPLLMTSCTKEDPEPPLASVVANFTYAGDNEETAPSMVTFSNSSTNAVSYTWDFGDGSDPSTEMNPTHLYESYGNFEVTLTAHNPESLNQTAEKKLTVIIKDPFAGKVNNIFFHNGDDYFIHFGDIQADPANIALRAFELGGMEKATGFAIDRENEKVYVAEPNLGYIYRFDMDGKNDEILFDYENDPDYVYAPYDLSIIDGMLYWVDPEIGIVRSDLDGANPEVLYPATFESMMPLAMAYDSQNEVLYFLNDGYDATGGLYKFDLPIEGEPVQITSADVADNLDATCLAIDDVNGKLYYAEYAAGIKCVDLDGSNKISIGETGDKATWGVEVDPNAGKVYWSLKYTYDTTDGAIMRADLDGQNKEVYYTAPLFYPNGIGLALYR